MTFSAETRVSVYSRTAWTLSLPISSVPLLGQNYVYLIMDFDGLIVTTHALVIPISRNGFVINCVLVYMDFRSIA